MKFFTLQTTTHVPRNVTQTIRPSPCFSGGSGDETNDGVNVSTWFPWFTCLL